MNNSATINGSVTYRAAQVVAPILEAQFARYQLEAFRQSNLTIAPEPNATVIEALIDAAFWASLRREEGHSPRISLAFLPPEQVPQPLLFRQRLPLRPGLLTKIAPGVERPGIHLGVWHDGTELYVWGTTNEVLSYCFIVDVSEPALLVIKHRRNEGFGKFTNVAILVGDQVKIVDENSASIPDCPAVLSSLLGFTAPSFWNSSVNVLVQLAVSMRAHHRGGTLLVVPAGSSSWQESIIHPTPYALQPHPSRLAQLLQEHPEDEHDLSWQASVRREVDAIAGLTAIDGATIITDQYELLAFGAKISRPPQRPVIEQIIMTEPVVGAEALIMHPSQTGGTRHLSAAQFVYDQQDAMALVASQDGRFTVFVWSPCEHMVHAHRIDSLLL